nr:MetaGeneMark_Unknown Function [uncultured bacterium]
MDNLTEAIILGLQAQMDFMETARTRHLVWADKAHKAEATVMHLEIASSYLQTRLQISRLLDNYREPSL